MRRRPFDPGGPRGPQESAPSHRKKHVLFVCLGNICRSPMAEALARQYGGDVLIASSAGLTPALAGVSHTRKILHEKNIDLGNHRPKAVDEVDLSKVDIVINMSGVRLPASERTKIEDWPIRDPYGADEDAYRKVCSELEMRVMNLILRIRSGKI